MKKKGWFEFGPFRFDPEAKLLYRDGVAVPTTLKILQTLAVLVENHGQLVEKERLMREVWPDSFVEENNLSQNISAIRKILNEGSGESWIETVPRRGFRLIAPVKYEESTRHRQKLRGVLVGMLGLAVGACLIWWNRASEPAAVRSLLVLPVLNVSGDPQQDYIADGMLDGLIGELARISPLRVISRTSAVAFRGTRKTVPQIARELGVDAVVEASIARLGDRVRIRAKLMQARDEQHLWSVVDDKDFGELGAAQAQIAQAIAECLGLPLKMRPVGSVNRAAYEEYLRGRYQWNKRTPEGIEKAIEHFRIAIEQDPAFSPAYAGLADSYNQMGTVFIGSRSPLETRPLAEAAARKALEIDDQLAEAHAARGYTCLYNWQWQDAERALRRALELKPGLAPAHSWYANLLIARGRSADAVAAAKRALDLDPLSASVRSTVALVLILAGREEEAITVCLRGLDISPNYPYLLLRLGFAYVSSGNYAMGIQTFEKGAAVTGRNAAFLDLLGEAYALSGQPRKSVEILNELESTTRRRYVSSIHRGLYTCLGLRQWDRAFAILEQGFQERANYIAYLGAIPRPHMYPEFRTNPRFQALIQRLKIQE